MHHTCCYSENLLKDSSEINLRSYFIFVNPFMINFLLHEHLFINPLIQIAINYLHIKLEENQDRII
jgi:hypothetical protein